MRFKVLNKVAMNRLIYIYAKETMKVLFYSLLFSCNFVTIVYVISGGGLTYLATTIKVVYILPSHSTWLYTIPLSSDCHFKQTHAHMNGDTDVFHAVLVCDMT